MKLEKPKIRNKTCNECIDSPEVFSGAIMPLKECFKYNWHVHRNGRGYEIFLDLNWKTKNEKLSNRNK